jgi:hypothetical protein
MGEGEVEGRKNRKGKRKKEKVRRETLPFSRPPILLLIFTNGDR